VFCDPFWLFFALAGLFLATGIIAWSGYEQVVAALRVAGYGHYLDKPVFMLCDDSLRFGVAGVASWAGEGRKDFLSLRSLDQSGDQ
jgi:hypothetical protein